MHEGKTIFQITLDNTNKFKVYYDISGIEEEEEALRIIHSLLDEYKQATLDQITEIKSSENEQFNHDD